MTNGYVIIGDMNCRFESLAKDVTARIRSAQLLRSVSILDLSYPVLHNDTNTAINNAEVLFNVCIKNLVVINNIIILDKYFKNNKMYKKRDTWI